MRELTIANNVYTIQIASYLPLLLYNLTTSTTAYVCIVVSVSEKGRFDGPEDGALWGVPGEEILVRPPGASMRFQDFTTLLAANLTETFYLE
jgi:hypothetical protein